MCWLSSCLVSHLNTKWEPSLLALWVKSTGDVEIIVDSGHQLKGNAVTLRDQPLKEDYLKAAVPVVVLLEVVWAAVAGQFDVVISKFLGLEKLRGDEVELVWWEAWLSNPLLKINLSQKSIKFNLIVHLQDVCLEHLNEIGIDDRFLGVGIDLHLDDVLDILWAEESLKVPDELEALLVRDLGE